MLRSHCKIFLALCAVLHSFAGCGGLQEMWSGPGAESFHPKSIAVLPPIVGQYEGAREAAAEVMLAALSSRKGGYDKIISLDRIRTEFDSKESSDTLTQFYAKLETTGQSDRELAAKLGKLLDAEALLIVKVSAWDYTRSEGDNLAKVSLGLRLVDGVQGGVVWKARQEKTKSYMFIKPNLRDVASGVAEEMVTYIPR